MIKEKTVNIVLAQYCSANGWVTRISYVQRLPRNVMAVVGSSGNGGGWSGSLSRFRLWNVNVSLGSVGVRTWTLWKVYLAKEGCTVPKHGITVPAVPCPPSPCSGVKCGEG